MLKDTILQARKNKMMILPDGSMCEMDGIKTRLNNNVIVLGSSGGGKTRSTVIPNILSSVGSYIIADPKGNLYRKYHDYFKSQGYRVVHLDFIHPEKSDKYNPLAYARTSDEIMRLAHQIIYSERPTDGNYDPFWDKADEMLLSALIGFIAEGGKCSSPNIGGVIELMNKINAAEIEELKTCAMDRIISEHAADLLLNKNEDSWAYRQWSKFMQTPPRTMNTILICLNTALGRLDTSGIQTLMSGNDFSLYDVGKNKTAVFVEISDTDRSKDLLATTFYSQAMSELCNYADSRNDSKLPVSVRFILDDFGTNCRIEGFENMISNIRSRDISAMVIIQSLSQLYKGYGESSHTILDNCDTLLYMGGNDVSTAEYIAKRSNKPFKSIACMPVGTHWCFRRGQQPKFGETVDLSQYELPTRKTPIKTA